MKDRLRKLIDEFNQELCWAGCGVKCETREERRRLEAKVKDKYAQAISDELNSRAGRTCKIDYERHCSNCGVYVHNHAVLVRKDLDGGAWTVISKPISYCPNCGAKVVEK